jgi:hypothetical protein
LAFNPRSPVVSIRKWTAAFLYQGRAVTSNRYGTFLLALALSVGLAGSRANADELLTLKLKDHQFSPTELTAPAGERFRIEVENLDATPAEFESSDLKVEKIVVGGAKVIVRVGPLKPGVYKFFDDYHPDEAKGTLTAIVPRVSQ